MQEETDYDGELRRKSSRKSNFEIGARRSNSPICVVITVVMGILLVANLVLVIIAIVKFSETSARVGYVTSALTNLSVTETNRGRAQKGELIFSDDFNTLNLDTWEHEITMSGGGNGEFQLYHNNRSNSFVKFGKLYIKPTLTAEKYGEDTLTNGEKIELAGGAPADKCTNDLFNGCLKTGSIRSPINPIMSARIRTLNSFSFKYGRVEVKAKIPTGDWLWPAIWMMPVKNQYGGWPTSGEIDIMESRGNVELYQNCERGPGCARGQKNIGTERVGSTLHYGPFFPQNGWEKAHFSKFAPSGKGFNQKFHLYQVEWTPEHLKFSVDDVEVGTSKPGKGGYWELGGFSDKLDNPWMYSENSRMAPFDQRFYIILNVAVGGTNGYFPDDATGGARKPWKNNSPNPMGNFWDAREDWLQNWENAGDDLAMQVDYVRVWAL